MQLTYASSLLANTLGFADISDSLATVNTQGAVRLIFSARSDNFLGSHVLGPAPAPQPQGNVAYLAQYGPDFALQSTPGLPRLFNLSRFNAPMVANPITASGAPGGAANVVDPLGGTFNDMRAAQVLEFASGDLLALARRQTEDVTLYRLADSGALSSPAPLPRGEKIFASGVSDTASIARGADQILLTLSGQDNGISSFRVTPGGQVEWIDSYGAVNGLAASGLAMLQCVQIGGVDFVLLAGSTSSSLTVLRVNAMGVFFECDHVIDTLDTRFARTAAFDGFVAQGRMFFAVAGSDSGVSVFELLPSGQLSHIETFVLEGGAGLGPVTAIEATPMASGVALMMVDAGADQIFRYDLALGNMGGLITAQVGLATGSAADERLLGGAGADTINAGAGDDFLHDGAGSDWLTGAAGVDTFVFARDGAVDRITDFQNGVDRIDIGAWGRIYSASALSIFSTATGAEVVYGDERLIITTADGSTLNAANFNDYDFIF